jgi:hypothetical protein
MLPSEWLELTVRQPDAAHIRSRYGPATDGTGP